VNRDEPEVDKEPEMNIEHGFGFKSGGFSSS